MKRELLFSFVGHAVALGIVALLGIAHVARDSRRPMVLSVSVVSPGTPLPQQAVKGTALVEPKPKAQGKPQPKPKTETKTDASTYKRQGLGARIEGAEALGYSYYLNVILTRLSENWLDPYLGQAQVLTATVVFVIEKDGTVREVKLEKTSGDRTYDESCTRALLVTDRFPPLPPEFTGPRLKLHLEFEHKP
jgi:TonB family protein